MRTYTLTDVNECKLGTDNCHDDAKCTNTDGSYTCQCRKGYRGDGVDQCVDIDECLDNSDHCDQNARCINAPGSYRCECKDGFMGDGFTCHG